MLDAGGRPRLAQVPEPEGRGTPLHVLACGLCGSDLEKLGPAHAGAVLGHEVAGLDDEGRRVALVHHRPCGRCARCAAGHETTCDAFRAPTIAPGGFAERVVADGSVRVPDAVPDAVATYVEPLACVLRGAELLPRGRVLVVGTGFVGRLFVAVLRRRGDEVFALEPRADRAVAPEPDGAVDAAVLCAPAGADDAARALAPGGTLLAFASAGRLDLDAVYRRELRVAGARGSTPEGMAEAAALLPELDVPEPTVLPLARFAEGLELYRSGRALKVVFTP